MTDERAEFRTLETGIGEVKAILGSDLTPVVFTPDRNVSLITREDFYSSTSRAAGFAYMPEKYKPDRVLYTVDFADGSKALVVHGKVSSGNPFEVMPATSGGIDRRETAKSVYLYDGDQTITLFTKDGQSDRFTGEHGYPETWLRSLKRDLGDIASVEKYYSPSET